MPYTIQNTKRYTQRETTMKYHLLISTILLSGCQMTSSQSAKDFERNVAPAETKEAYVCPYDKHDAPEYKYVGKPKYLSNLFDKDVSHYRFSDAEKKALTGMKFKFGGHAVGNEYGLDYATTKVIDGKLYAFKSNIRNPVMFEDCKASIWFSGHTNYHWLDLESDDPSNSVSGIVRVDGKKPSVEDLINAYGANNVKEIEAKVTIDSDEYANSSTLRTEFVDNILLRTWSDGAVKKKPTTFQVYADLKFFEDWGHIKTARTKDGKSRKVTKITTDVNCSDFGCTLTESVGVTLPVSMLKKNPKGFGIKFYGTQQREIFVNEYLVKSMMKGISDIK